MRTKLTILFIALFLLIGFLGSCRESSLQPAEVNLKVIKVDGVWKVVLASDYSKTTVKVKRNEIITWTLVGTDAYFQFPENLLESVDSSDNLKKGYTKSKKDGQSLKLKIKDNAKAGIYEYSVFCTADSEFAEGG